MLPLAQRHEDRAKRKALNSTTADVGVRGADHLSPIVEMIVAAQSQLESLSSEDRAEVEARLRNEFEPSEGYVASDPATTYAGIGILNPFVAPSQLAGNGAGSGEALSNLTPEQIQAIADEAIAKAKDREAAEEAQRQAAAGSTGWGGGSGSTGETDETIGADGKPLTAKELKAILDARKVSYESDANLATLQGLVKANPALAA